MEGDSPFTDVENSPATAWYYDAALWAHQKGIVAGYADQTWHPADPVSLEQLAVMFRNYANYRGYDLTAADDLPGYADAGEVTEWAKESVRWAADRGMMNGGSSAVLNPAGIVTRARAAFMLCRFIEVTALCRLPPSPERTGTWQERAAQAAGYNRSSASGISCRLNTGDGLTQPQNTDIMSLQRSEGELCQRVLKS